MLAGPGNWCDQSWREHSDMHFLRELFGQSSSFRSLACSTSASQLRVMHTHTDAIRNRITASGLSIQQMYEDIRYCMRDPIELDRIILWREWFLRSHVACVIGSRDHLSAQGILLADCLREIAGDAAIPWAAEVRRKQKRDLQKVVYKKSLANMAPDPVERIRTHMDRWMDHEAPGVQEVSTTMKIPGPPAWVSTQVCRRLQHLPHIAPPRVCAAAWRTLFNGWCTERRFQRIGSAADQCWLGCGEGGHDSIEHYCRCPLGIDVLREKLNIVLPRRDAMQLWMLGHAAQESGDILALGALFVYGVYMTTNHY